MNALLSHPARRRKQSSLATLTVPQGNPHQRQVHLKRNAQDAVTYLVPGK
jgi:hypothetical protein